MKRLIALFLLLPSIAWGAPAVSSYSGTLSHGSSITISGTDFGTKSVAAPLVFDNFEAGGSVGQAVTASTGADWLTDGTSPKISTDENRPSVPGSRNAKAIVSGINIDGNYHDLMYVGSLDLNPYFYIGFWARLASYAPGNQVKYWRLASAGSTRYPTYSYFRTDGWARYQWTNPSGSTCTTAGTAWFDTVENTNLSSWQFIEMIGNLGTAGSANGSVRVYHNGVDQGGKSNYLLFTSASCEPNGARFGEYIQDANGTVTNYFDDIYVDNSWARVYLCSNSTLATSTHRELQVPSAWGTTSITATVNRGSFAPGATAYLVVVDSTGTASPGYAVTIGGTSTDTTAPTVSGYSPAKSATSQPIDTDITAIISDAGTGIDVNTITMSVEGAVHCCSSMTGTCPSSGTKDLACTGSVSAITATKGSNTFSNSQTVDIILGASDIQGNAMGADSYSFVTTAGGADATAPVVTITAPTTQTSYYTDDSAITFSGTASDNVAVSSVAWANSQGGSGTATGLGPWSVDVLPLAASTFGSTLATNGLFASDYSSWTTNNATVSQGTNADRANSVSIADNGAWSELSQTITVENGELYLIEALVYSADSDWPENGSILVDMAAARTDTWGDAQLIGNGTPNTWQTLAGVVRAVGTSMTVRLHSEDIYTAYFDSVSVRKVTGANVITVTSTDSSANTGTDMLTIVYNPPAPAASAPIRVMVQDANGRTWVYDANGVRLETE